MLWSIGDSRPNGDLAIELDYFEGAAYHSYEESSYAGDGKINNPTSLSFNHGLAEVFNALWENEMEIELFEEHRSVPWNPLGEEFVKLEHIDEWELSTNPNRLAASYTILARLKK